MKSSCKQEQKNNTSTSSEVAHLAVRTGIDVDILTLCFHIHIGITSVCLFVSSYLLI
jgi:hypothetical protein